MKLLANYAWLFIGAIWVGLASVGLSRDAAGIVFGVGFGLLAAAALVADAIREGGRRS